MAESLVQSIFTFVHGLPLWSAKLFALAIFAAAIALVWLLPKAYVYAEGEVLPWQKDLRIWASLLLLVQLGLYWIF